MFARKNQQGQHQHKHAEDARLHPRLRLQLAHPLFLSGFSTGLRARRGLVLTNFFRFEVPNMPLDSSSLPFVRIRRLLPDKPCTHG